MSLWDTTSPFGSRFAGVFVYSRLRSEFNLEPQQLTDLIRASAAVRRSELVAHARLIQSRATVLFAERIYEAMTILKGSPTKKPFREEGDLGLEEFFGLEPQGLALRFRKDFPPDQIDPALAAGHVRKIINQVLLDSFEAAIALLQKEALTAEQVV